MALTLHEHSRRLEWPNLAFIGHTAATQGDRMDGSSTGVYVMTKAPYGPFIEGHVAHMSFVGWSSNILKRVARSSLSADTQQACNTNDEVFAAQLLRSEPNGYTLKKHNVTDAVKARLDSLSWMQTECTTRHICSSSRAPGLTEKRSAIDLLGLKEQHRRARCRCPVPQ